MRKVPQGYENMLQVVNRPLQKCSTRIVYVYTYYNIYVYIYIQMYM